MNADTLQLLTPEQISASRERLISEGFIPVSKAVRVHDQLLAATREIEMLRQANERNTEGAWQSMKNLTAECERRGHDIERLHAEREWRPISTAPIDGTWVVLYTGNAEAPKCTCAVWIGGKWYWELVDGQPCGGIETSAVTQWMPLPTLPGSEDVKESDGA